MKSFYKQYGVSPEGLVSCLDQSDPRSYGDLTNWYDLSGLQNHGIQATAGNQPVIGGVAGLSGMARTFDGISDFVNWESPSGNVCAVSVWFKPTNEITKITGPEGLIEFDAATAYTCMSLGTSSGLALDETLMMQNSQGGASGRTYITDNISAEWHNIIFYWNGSKYDLVLNGVKQVTTAGTNGDAALISLVNLGLGIAQIDGSRYANGSVAIFQIFSRILSVGETQNLYNATRRRFGK